MESLVVKNGEYISDEFTMVLDYEYTDFLENIEDKKISMIICSCCKKIFIQKGKEAIYEDDGEVFCSKE